MIIDIGSMPKINNKNKQPADIQVEAIFRQPRLVFFNSSTGISHIDNLSITAIYTPTDYNAERIPAADTGMATRC